MAEINVTPFVDVMLVLLIIFMVTAPLLASGVPVDLPDSRANPLDQDAGPGHHVDRRARASSSSTTRGSRRRASRAALSNAADARRSARRAPLITCGPTRARLRPGDGGDGRAQPRRFQRRSRWSPTVHPKRHSQSMMAPATPTSRAKNASACWWRAWRMSRWPWPS
jgi:hypothetical protein